MCGERHPKTEEARGARGNHSRAWACPSGSPVGKRRQLHAEEMTKPRPASQTFLSPPLSTPSFLLPSLASPPATSQHLLLPPSSSPSRISPSPLVPSLPEPLSLRTLLSPFSSWLSTLVLASPPPLPAVNLGMDRAIVLRASGPRRRRGRCERGHSGAFVCVPAAVNALLVHSCTKMAGTAAPTQASPFGGVQGACPGGHIALFVWSPAEAEDNAFISLSGLRVLEGWQGRGDNRTREGHFIWHLPSSGLTGRYRRTRPALRPSHLHSPAQEEDRNGERLFSTASGSLLLGLLRAGGLARPEAEQHHAPSSSSRALSGITAHRLPRFTGL